MWVEDTVWMEVYIDQAAGIVTLKSITIPANTLKGHFRVFWNVSVYSFSGCNQGDIQTELRVNNDLVQDFLGTTGSPTHAGIGFVRSRSVGGDPNRASFVNYAYWRELVPWWGDHRRHAAY